MPLHVSQHPLVAHKLAILRDKTTEPKKFRELVRELTWLLGYEAMADLATRPQAIETPLEPMTAARLEPKVGLIPILRAGLGMAAAWPSRRRPPEACPTASTPAGGRRSPSRTTTSRPDPRPARSGW